MPITTQEEKKSRFGGSRLVSAALSAPFALFASASSAQEVESIDENTGFAGIINNIATLIEQLVPVVFMGAGAGGAIFTTMAFIDLKKMSDGQGGGPQGPNWGGIAFKFVSGIALVSLAAFIAFGTETLAGSSDDQFESPDNPFGDN